MKCGSDSIHITLQKFGCDKEHGEGTMFCGVFDGHGRHGHRVSRSVRDRLPNILARSWQRLQPCLDDIRNYSSFSSSSNSDDSETDNNNIVSDHYHQHFMMRGDPSHIFAWKESFHAAYKKMDKELARGDFDTLSSGTTAVALIKQVTGLLYNIMTSLFNVLCLTNLMMNLGMSYTRRITGTLDDQCVYTYVHKHTYLL